ncbi:MAG: Glu/Leu/Phe/Val dehydrogenase dimerization domain-containing protein [Myxococcota bacterium]
MPDRATPHRFPDSGSTAGATGLFEHPEFDGHEQVVFCHDPEADLRAVIAIHSTRLGPAAGGCRMYDYASVEDAVHDVLRLSHGMTLKSAVAGLPLGGGKGVILADPRAPGKAERLRAFGRHVQRLAGQYWTAMDVGVGPADVEGMVDVCDYVFTCTSHYPDGFDPSQFTSLGGFTGIRAVAAHAFGKDDLEGLRVAVQGVGSTGRDLCRQLHAAGTRLVVADVDPAATAYAVDHFDAIPAEPDAIYDQDVDIFAPCALGGVINDATLPRLRARAVCGLANNQLAEPRHGEELRRRGILYAPDFVVNAGGMIGASRIIYAEMDRERSFQQIHGIADTLREIFERADRSERAPETVALDVAQEALERASETGN